MMEIFLDNGGKEKVKARTDAELGPMIEGETAKQRQSRRMKLYNHNKKVCLLEEPPEALASYTAKHQTLLLEGHERRRVQKIKAREYDQEVEEPMAIDEVGELVA
jgi:hypothetical protein